MFELFPSQWTPLLFSRELKNKPVAARVAGEDVVLFRDPAGHPHALLDRCPHRGVALSLGKIDKEGRLECPFHWWAFEGDGRCTNVPFNKVKDDFCTRAAADALPCVEQGGFVWVFTEVGASPEGPYTPPELESDRLARYDLSSMWSTHWTRAMENMLDAPHLPYVHRTTIGMGLRKPALAGEVMFASPEDNPHGFSVHWRLEHETPSTTGKLHWLKPNGMVLPLAPPPRVFQQNLYVVPVDEGSTRMMISSLRSFGRYNPLMRIGDWFNHWILFQDKAVVESSTPSEVPAPADEVSVATDAPTLAFRKWYRDWRRSLHADGDVVQLRQRGAEDAAAG